MIWNLFDADWCRWANTNTNTFTMWWMMNKNGHGNAHHGNKQQSEQRMHQNGYEMVTEMFEY